MEIFAVIDPKYFATWKYLRRGPGPGVAGPLSIRRWDNLTIIFSPAYIRLSFFIAHYLWGSVIVLDKTLTKIWIYLSAVNESDYFLLRNKLKRMIWTKPSSSNQELIKFRRPWNYFDNPDLVFSHVLAKPSHGCLNLWDWPYKVVIT